MRRLLWPLGLAAVLSSPLGAAQPRPDPVPILGQVPAAGAPLTLDAALALAAASNPALAAAAKEADALQGGVTQAGVLPNPDIVLGVEDTRRDSRTTRVEIGIPVELGGKRSARILAAERAQTAAVAELAQARAQLRAAAVAAFFDLLIAQEGLELAAGSAQVAARASDIAARRVAAGKVAPLEETRARVERANAELETDVARARVQEARRALGSLWGESEPDFGKAVGSLDILPARPPIDRLLQDLERAPELVAHRLEIERRDAVVGVERSKRYPDLRLTAGTQRNNELGRNQTLLGISIPLPLFDRNQGNLYEATVRADQARDLHRALQVRLAHELRQACARLELARRSADTLKATVLPGARDAYESATRGFEAGKSGFLDVLDAQRTLFRARIRYLAVLADTYQAAIAIDRVLGY